MSDDKKETPQEQESEAVKAADKAAEISKQEKEQREKQRLEKKFVKYSLLIAEDDINLQQALVQEAEERGFKVVTAADGAEAVRKAQTQGFDIILIDMNLPKKLGHEAVTEIRASGLSKKSQIIVLSGYLKKEVVTALAGKIQKAFTKPADIDLVMESIQNLLEGKDAKKTG